MELRVKININEFLEKYAKLYEEIQYCIDNTEEDNMEIDEFYERIKQIDFGIPFIELYTLNGYLKDIAQRAIELNDKKLLEYCEGIGIVKEDK